MNEDWEWLEIAAMQIAFGIVIILTGIVLVGAYFWVTA